MRVSPGEIIGQSAESFDSRFLHVGCALCIHHLGQAGRLAGELGQVLTLLAECQSLCAGCGGAALGIRNGFRTLRSPVNGG